jgi:hypothetical protein
LASARLAPRNGFLSTAVAEVEASAIAASRVPSAGGRVVCLFLRAACKVCGDASMVLMLNHGAAAQGSHKIWAGKSWGGRMDRALANGVLAAPDSAAPVDAAWTISWALMLLVICGDCLPIGLCVIGSPW